MKQPLHWYNFKEKNLILEYLLVLNISIIQNFLLNICKIKIFSFYILYLYLYQFCTFMHIVILVFNPVPFTLFEIQHTCNGKKVNIMQQKKISSEIVKNITIFS